MVVVARPVVCGYELTDGYNRQVKTSIAAIVLMLVAATAPARTIVIGGLDGTAPSDSSRQYEVALALSGGGARGLAVIGALKAFEEKGIAVAGLTGTSIGGIVGGLYACGYSPDDLADLVYSIDRSGMFSNQPNRTSMFLTQRQERGRHILSVRLDGLRPVIPQALTAGQRLTELLTRLTSRANYLADGDFSRLHLPFKTIATDIVSGRTVVLDSGSIVDAMRATMAFPLAFTPLQCDGRLLMDGGMVVPIPVELARTVSDSTGFVVAINTASPLQPRSELVTPIDIANQATSIMTADKLRQQLAAADYVIEFDIDWASTSDFNLADSLIAVGYREGLAAADSVISHLRARHHDRRYRIDSVACEPTPSAWSDSLRQSLVGRMWTDHSLTCELSRLAIERQLYRLEAELESLPNRQGPQAACLVLRSRPGLPASSVSFHIEGNQTIEDSTIAALLVDTCSVLSGACIKQGLERIIDEYRKRGHDLAEITGVSIDPEANRIALGLDEGLVHRIEVEGNERTREWFIRANFPLREGRPYSSSLAARGQADIYGTDLFDRVTIEMKRSDDGPVVVVGVQEKAYLQLRLGWHWHDDYDSEEFVELLDDNLLGAGIEGRLHARYAPDRQSYYSSVRADRIFDTYLTGRIRLLHNRLNRYLYDSEGQVTAERKENRTGLEFRLGQQISRLGTASAALRAEHVEYRSPEGVESDFGLRVLHLQSLVETFNRRTFPETGKRHLFEIEFAGEFLGGDVEYTKFYSSVEAYWQFGPILNYHPSLAVGISRSGLPPSEKFYMGGMRSFMGLRTYQLGGDKLFHMSHEVRFKLPWRLYLTGRYDLGEVFTSVEDIKARRFRHGGGAILALDSPIGPFQFAYGWSERDMKRFYIHIGLRF